MYGPDILPNAFKFFVQVYFDDSETADAIEIGHEIQVPEYGGVQSVRDSRDGAKTNVPQYCMKERMDLSKEEIHAKRDGWWCSRKLNGMGMGSYVGTRGEALLCVIFPLRVATSGL